MESLSFVLEGKAYPSFEITALPLQKAFQDYPLWASSNRTSDCLVVVPTYNEKENIQLLVQSIKGLEEPLDILVVDDNSPDGTADVVMGMMESVEGLYLLKRKSKMGLGSAYKAAFSFVLKYGWEYVVQMDADFSHEPKDVCRLLKTCREGNDVVIGSRYVKGGRIEGWPWKRWLLSRSANLYAQILTRSKIKDLTGGFKCFSRNALKKIDLEKVQSEGYIFQVEMNYRALRKRLKVKQIPICFKERKNGQSKMGFDEAKSGFFMLFNVVCSKT